MDQGQDSMVLYSFSLRLLRGYLPTQRVRANEPIRYRRVRCVARSTPRTRLLKRGRGVSFPVRESLSGKQTGRGGEGSLTLSVEGHSHATFALLLPDLPWTWIGTWKKPDSKPCTGTTPLGREKRRETVRKSEGEWEGERRAVVG